MARLSKITPSSIIAVLTNIAASPSEIGKALGGIPRSTLHRHLFGLAKQGLVTKVGRGKNSSYRIPSPYEMLSFEHEKNLKSSPGSLVRMEMSIYFANFLNSALEIFSRIGIGQIEQIAFPLSFETYGPGALFSDEQMHLAEKKINLLKAQITGMSINSSHGIFSQHVSVKAQKSWAIYRAIRHRLAWDANPSPTGFMGVNFDEPVLALESIPGLIVLSSQDESGLPMITTEMSLDTAEVVLLAMRTQAKLSRYDLTAITDLAREGLIRDGHGCHVGESVITGCIPLAQEISKGLGISPSYTCSASEICTQIANAIQAKISEEGGKNAIESFSDRGNFFAISRIHTDSPAPRVSLKVLPDRCFVLREKDKFRVIGPDSNPAYLRVLSESHSLQTAIFMALNKLSAAQGSPAPGSF